MVIVWSYFPLTQASAAIFFTGKIISTSQDAVGLIRLMLEAGLRIVPLCLQKSKHRWSRSCFRPGSSLPLHVVLLLLSHRCTPILQGCTLLKRMTAGRKRPQALAGRQLPGTCVDNLYKMHSAYLLLFMHVWIWRYSFLNIHFES